MYLDALNKTSTVREDMCWVYRRCGLRVNRPNVVRECANPITNSFVVGKVLYNEEFRRLKLLDRSFQHIGGSRTFKINGLLSKALCLHGLHDR